MLGMPTTMVGQVGSDGGADFMLQHLQQRSVALDGTVRRIPNTPTGTANVMLLPSGENSIIIVGGANTADWEMSDEQQAAILNAGVVLLQARPWSPFNCITPPAVRRCSKLLFSTSCFEYGRAPDGTGGVRVSS